MGKVRRGGYVLFWWIGDHEPRHIHVRTAKGKKLGRVNLEKLEGLEGWTPPKDLVKLIVELKNEGRL